MDRFNLMQAFVAVVEAGSFVAAADRLKQSTASVSKQVAQLENQVGVRLLHRTTRRVSLTADGTLFVERCRDMLQQWRDAEDEVANRSTTAQGLLRVNVPVSYGMSHLAALWAGFMRANPEVNLDIILSDRVADLVDEGFDLAVRIGQLPSSSLISRRLAKTRLTVCASPDYLRTYPAPDNPTELGSHRILSYSLLSSGDTWTFTSRDEPSRQASVRVLPIMRSNNGDTCRDAAVRGQGVVMQPDFLLRSQLTSGELIELMPRWLGQELGIYVVYPSRRHLPAKVRLLIDYLGQQLSSH
jgi:DNA-binding transcriptional LysR family regulator